MMWVESRSVTVKWEERVETEEDGDDDEDDDDEDE